MAVLHGQATRIVWDCGHFEQKNVVTLSTGNSFSSVIALNDTTILLNRLEGLSYLF